MKYTIMGISQAKAIEYGLDLTDIAIYAWFEGIVASNPKTLEKDGKLYYWLNYQTLLDDMPVIKIKKDTLYRILRRLVEKGVLTHYVLRNSEGVFSYYGYGENARGLKYTHTEKNPYDTSKNPYALTEKNPEQRIDNYNKTNNERLRDLLNI